MQTSPTSHDPSVALDKSQRRLATFLGLFPPLHKLPVKVFRQLFFAMDRLFGLPCTALENIVDYSIETAEHPVTTAAHQSKIRVYYPSKTPLEHRTMVYFHGGGCVIGSIETHDRFCRYLAKHANMNIISADYRLAPEFPFPVPIIDAISSWNWVHENHKKLNINPNAIGVGGDSAGAYLACLISLLPEQEVLPVQTRVKPTFQFLLYPIVDQQGKTESYIQSTRNLILTKDLVDYFKSQYVPADQDASQPLISPLQTRHLAHCPNTYLLTVGYDPLRDDGLTFAKQLTQAGCPLQHHHIHDCMHAFISLARISQRAKQASHQVALALAALAT